MFAARGSIWGPSPLPEFLTEQLSANGLTADDAGRCARRINERPSGSDAASLFVDLGACKFLEGDIDGAVAAWRHALSSSDDAAASRGLLNLGLLYEHLHLHDRAIGLLEAVASRDVDPYVVPGAMASARCFLARGEGDRAMETMARLAQRMMAHEPEGPELVETLYGLGEIADAAGRSDRAERAWQVAAAGPISEVQRAARDRLVTLLRRQGRLDEALGHLAEPFDAASRNAALPNGGTPQPVALDLIEALRATGDDERARALAASIDAAALSTPDQFRLAELRWRCGVVNEAIDVLEVLLSDGNDSEQVRAAYLLGQIYAGYDMVGPAHSMFDRVAEANDRVWSLKAVLAQGDLFESEGDHEAAVDQWTRAAESSIASLHDQAAARLDTEPTERARPGVDESAATITGHDPGDHAFEPVEDELPAAAAEPEMVVLDDMVLDEVVLDEMALDDPVLDDVVHAESAALEPVVVVLNSVDVDEATATATSDVSSIASSAAANASSASSPFASHLDGSDDEDPNQNPYAALAPDNDAVEIAASTRNPYAELAPDFADGQYEPPPDVEPGDWESMLEDWPKTSGTPAPAEEDAGPKSSAFSRYT